MKSADFDAFNFQVKAGCGVGKQESEWCIGVEMQ